MSTQVNVAASAVPTEGLAALLHVSAAVTVVAMAFLGWDHVQANPDLIKKIMASAKDEATEALRGIDTKATDIKEELGLGKVRLMMPVCVLCLVAQEPFDMRWWWRPVFWAYFFAAFPFLRYFRSGWYKHLVLMIASLSAALLFGLSLAAIYRWHYAEVPLLQAGILGTLAFFLMVIVATSLLSSMQAEHKLKAGCQRLLTRAVAARERFAAKSHADAIRYGRIPPPSPPSPPAPPPPPAPPAPPKSPASRAQGGAAATKQLGKKAVPSGPKSPPAKSAANRKVRKTGRPPQQRR